MTLTGVAGLFPSGACPTAVSDSGELLSLFEGHGFPTASIEDIRTRVVAPPGEVVLIPVQPVEHPIPGLDEALRDSAVLILPLLAFNTEERSIRYLINRLATIDFAEACQRGKGVVLFLRDRQAPITVTSDDCTLSIELGEDLEVFAPKIEPKIKPGEWISIIQFLEVAIVPHDRGPSFSATGSLLCDGVAMAHHLHTHLTMKDTASGAWKLVDDLRKNGQFPLRLTFENSRIVDITTRDGKSILADLLPFTDEVLRGEITEVGFASLSPDDTTDWSINSQLNEPAGGLHIGLGAGETGIHIDFISSHATVSDLTGHWQK